jgi:hypothetical protein
VVAGLLPRQREYSRISIRSKDTDRVLVFGVTGSSSRKEQDPERGKDDDNNDEITVSAAFGSATTALQSGLGSGVPHMMLLWVSFARIYSYDLIVNLLLAVAVDVLLFGG